MTARILFVDDDPNLLAALQRNLRKVFEFDTALGGAEALELIRSRGPYAVLVADKSMPGMDGIEFLERSVELAPDAVRVMLTGNADQGTAVDALNRGQVFRFLNKPCPTEILVPVLEAALKHFQLVQMERELLEGTVSGSVKMLSEVLGMVSPQVLGRSQRLRDSMHLFALYINAAPLWELEVAALLSSVGSAALPTKLLAKLGTGEERTIEEERIVRRIPQIGHDLLIGIPRLSGVARIIQSQNDAFDGSASGQTELTGEKIPLGARMLRVLVDRTTLESEGIVKQRALAAMRARAGVYDPRLLEQCFACFGSFLSNPLSGDRPVRTLAIGELVVNQVTISDIVTPEGLVLVGSGSTLTPMIIQRLRNYEILGDVNEPVLVQDPDPSCGIEHQKRRNAA